MFSPLLSILADSVSTLIFGFVFVFLAIEAVASEVWVRESVRSTSFSSFVCVTLTVTAFP